MQIPIVAEFIQPITQTSGEHSMTRLLLALHCQILALKAYAQTQDILDVSSIDGIINAYYQVVSGPTGESVDVARDRYLHHPNAWVSIAGKDANNIPAVSVMTLADYHGDNLPRSQGFYEKEIERMVSRSGNMVHVWSSYTSVLTFVTWLWFYGF